MFVEFRWVFVKIRTEKHVFCLKLIQIYVFRGSRRHAEQELDELFLIVIRTSILDEFKPSLGHFKGGGDTNNNNDKKVLGARGVRKDRFQPERNTLGDRV